MLRIHTKDNILSDQGRAHLKMTFIYMHSESAPGCGQEQRDASRERVRFLEIGKMEFLC